MKEPKLIKKKIKSFAHQEFNQTEFTDVNEIERRIESGVDLFDREYKYKKVEIDEQFPEYILENKLKFKNWIL